LSKLKAKGISLEHNTIKGIFRPKPTHHHPNQNIAKWDKQNAGLILINENK
jgi:hypothetical protein